MNCRVVNGFAKFGILTFNESISLEVLGSVPFAAKHGLDDQDSSEDHQLDVLLQVMLNQADSNTLVRTRICRVILIGLRSLEFNCEYGSAQGPKIWKTICNCHVMAIRPTAQEMDWQKYLPLGNHEPFVYLRL